RARADLAALSEHYEVPVENLLSPDSLRRVLWSPPELGDDPQATIGEVLTALGARPWQRELTAPVIAEVLQNGPNP
ncbi:MAG: ribonuclease D, partial [Actinobacteria bacterium]|nr:ribonuclease D [Actinomycetota bacterium]